MGGGGGGLHVACCVLLIVDMVVNAMSGGDQSEVRILRSSPSSF